MSYLAFLVLFLIAPICLILLVLHGRVNRVARRALGLTMLVAFMYTAPWDNAIILNGVWSFSPRHVLNVVIGVVPLEEYLFYILQVLLTGLLTIWLLQHLSARGE